MKKLALVLLGVMIICFGALPVHALLATFNPPDDPLVVNVGDSFGIDVFALGDIAWGDLAGFGFSVDTTGLSHVSYDGFTLGPNYEDPRFSPPTTVSGTDSKIEAALDLSLLPPVNEGDNVLLATLSFTALSIGIDTLQLLGDFDIVSNSGLFYFLQDESLKGQTDIAVVPEPTTILLLSSGLLGLAGVRRKMKKKS